MSRERARMSRKAQMTELIHVAVRNAANNAASMMTNGWIVLRICSKSILSADSLSLVLCPGRTVDPPGAFRPWRQVGGHYTIFLRNCHIGCVAAPGGLSG
jgi:hypothetical protein